jgi:hypothetical protein
LIAIPLLSVNYAPELKYRNLYSQVTMSKIDDSPSRGKRAGGISWIFFRKNGRRVGQQIAHALILTPELAEAVYRCADRIRRKIDFFRRIESAQTESQAAANLIGTEPEGS